MSAAASPRTRLRLPPGAPHAWGLRACAATWRVRWTGLDALDRRLAAGVPAIVVFWHAKYLPLLPLLRGRAATVFTSRSARGDAIAGTLRRFGFRPVQLPDHGGEASLALMREALRAGGPCAIAVDGPLGPRHVVHRGAIELAASLGRPLVPVSIVARRQRVFAGRWDRLEWPRLGTAVQGAVGEPMRVPRTLDADGLARWAGRVHDRLERLEREAVRALRARGRCRTRLRT